MAKEYISIVRAEQFDGSDEMMEKYNLYEYVIKGFKPVKRERKIFVRSKFGYPKIDKGDYIVTGINGEILSMKLIFLKRRIQRSKMDKSYIFLGQDIDTDDCFINRDMKENIYYIDSKVEADHTRTQFTKGEVKLIRRRLKWLWIDDDNVIPVGNVDDK